MIKIFFTPYVFRYSLALSLLVFSFIGNVAHAAVSVFETDLHVKILIHGKIDDRTVVSFNDAITKAKIKKQGIFWILLNSEGGSVDAAIEIGRIIRASNLAIKNQGVCFSSCVLIYIAGVHRYNFPDIILDYESRSRDSIIGLHRPYFSAGSSQTMSKEAIKAMYEKVRNYISEMGVSDRLFELIYNTPPEKVITLRAEKIESIIPVDDPEFDEKRVQQKSLEYGISAADYRRKREVVRRGLLDPSSKCGVMY